MIKNELLEVSTIILKKLLKQSQSELLLLFSIEEEKSNRTSYGTAHFQNVNSCKSAKFYFYLVTYSG